MKKLLVAISFISLTVGLAVPSNPVRAAALGQIIWDGTTAMPDSYPAAMVGDSFEFDNSNGPIVMLVNASGTIKEQGGQTCTPHSCYVNQMSAIWFDVLGLGTVEVQSANGTVLETITLGAGGGASGPATVVNSSLDANGGSCLFGGTVRSKYDSTTIGYSYAPGNDECARSQCVLVGWNVSSSATTPVPANLPLLKVDDTLAKRAFVAKSGDFVADWVQAPKFDSIFLKPGEFTTLTWDSECRGLVQFDASGSCSFSGSSSVKVSGEVTIIAGGQAGSCAVTATPVFTAYQNLDGTLPVSTPSPTLPSSTFTVIVEAPSRSIVITGERTTVNGKPGICVYGQTTGFADGYTVVPYVRFPGQTAYTQGSARPVVGADGSFEWCRKTGKKTYVYFTSSDGDGSVTSNRIIIPAN